MYITLLDGHAYAVAGTTGMLVTDAVAGIFTCILATVLLARFDSRAARAATLSVVLTGTVGDER